MPERFQFDEISWRLFLNTGDPRKAERIIRRLNPLLQVNLEVISMERYWKDESLTEVRLRSQMSPVSKPSEATYTLLMTVQRLVHRVTTAGPQLFEGGEMEMSAFASDGFVEPGVSLMEACIRSAQVPTER